MYLGKDVLEQHNNCVALVFSEYGINEPVTRQNLLKATHIYGAKFLNRIKQLISEQESNFNGSDIKNVLTNVLGSKKTVQKPTEPATHAFNIKFEHYLAAGLVLVIALTLIAIKLKK